MHAFAIGSFCDHLSEFWLSLTPICQAHFSQLASERFTAADVYSAHSSDDLSGREEKLRRSTRLSTAVRHYSFFSAVSFSVFSLWQGSRSSSNEIKSEFWPKSSVRPFTTACSIFTFIRKTTKNKEKNVRICKKSVPVLMSSLHRRPVSSVVSLIFAIQAAQRRFLSFFFFLTFAEFVSVMRWSINCVQDKKKKLHRISSVVKCKLLKSFSFFDRDSFYTSFKMLFFFWESTTSSIVLHNNRAFVASLTRLCFTSHPIKLTIKYLSLLARSRNPISKLLEWHKKSLQLQLQLLAKTFFFLIRFDAQVELTLDGFSEAAAQVLVQLTIVIFSLGLRDFVIPNLSIESAAEVFLLLIFFLCTQNHSISTSSFSYTSYESTSRVLLFDRTEWETRKLSKISQLNIH